MSFVEGIKLLARTEGIFTEPAGGTEVGITRKVIEQGKIPRDDRFLLASPDNGYKTLEAVAGGSSSATRLKPRWKISFSSINI